MFKTIIPGAVYQWGDAVPYFGLDSVSDLDIESKSKKLFGYCDIKQRLTPSHLGSAVLFETYIGLDLDEQITQIYFPSWFLVTSWMLKEKLGADRPWSRSRTHNVACLMNRPRYPRVIASCWLANNYDLIDLVYTQNWEPDAHMPALHELLQIGGLKDWTGEWGPNLIQLPEKRVSSWNDHDITTNFEMLYDAVYSRAASAVVIGAVCWERGAEICEKYLCAVLSCCIPVVHGYGIYDRLKLLGFDVFDDLIDTSSQWDQNPITAAWSLWENNRDFFKQAKDIVADSKVQTRLQHNFDLAQDPKTMSHNAIHALNSVRAQDLWYQHQLWHHLSWDREKQVPWNQWFTTQ